MLDSVKEIKSSWKCSYCEVIPKTYCYNSFSFSFIGSTVELNDPWLPTLNYNDKQCEQKEGCVSFCILLYNQLLKVCFCPFRTKPEYAYFTLFLFVFTPALNVLMYTFFECMDFHACSVNVSWRSINLFSNEIEWVTRRIIKPEILTKGV